MKRFLLATIGLLVACQNAALAYTLMGNDRILLMNDDTKRFAAVSSQGYDATNSAAKTYWVHDNAAPGFSPNLLRGTNHVMYAQDGTRLWELVNCRAGSGTVVGNSMRNYIPWSSTAKSILDGTTKIPEDSTGAKAVGSVIFRNVEGACLYSPYYEEGIGTIYFDAVNAFVNTLEGEIALEIATNVTAAAESAGVEFPSITDNYGDLDWVPCPLSIFTVTAGPGTTNVVLQSDCESNVAVLSSTAGGSGIFYRMRAQLNWRAPIRFRIRRLNATGGHADMAGLVLIDNIIASYPPMTATLGRHGVDFDNSLTGSDVVGCNGDLNVPFLANIQTNIIPFVSFTFLTNSSATTAAKIQDPTFHYRWRYLNQQVGDWQSVPFDPVVITSTSYDSTNLAGSIGFDLNMGTGDLEYFFTATIDAPYYNYRDYAYSSVLPTIGYGDNWTEKISAVTNRAAYTMEDALPSGGTDWFTRIRAGASDYAYISLVGEVTTNGAWGVDMHRLMDAGAVVYQNTSENMALVGDHMWRYHYYIPTNAIGERIRFHFEGVKASIAEEPFAFSVSTNVWYANSMSVPCLPYTMVATGSSADKNEAVVELDASATHLLIEFNDETAEFTISRAAWQNFNEWTDAMDGYRIMAGASDRADDMTSQLANGGWTDARSWRGWNVHTEGWNGDGTPGRWANLDDAPDGLSCSLNFSALSHENDTTRPETYGIGLGEPENGFAYSANNPFVQCPEMTNGIGRVSFKARTFETNAVTPSVLILYGTTDPEASQSDPVEGQAWTRLAEFVISNSAYQTYSWTTTDSGMAQNIKAVRLEVGGARHGRYPSFEDWERPAYEPSTPIQRVVIDDTSVSEAIGPKPTAPVISTPAENMTYVHVPGGNDYDFKIAVADAAGETGSGAKYTVYWSNSGNGIYTAYTNLTLVAGELTVTAKYMTGGTFVTQFYVVNQDGFRSEVRTITVQVDEPKVIALAADRDTRRYNEGETATISLTLSEPFSAATVGYLFLVPQDADSSNLVDCAQFATGVPIQAGSAVPDMPPKLTFLDGKPSTLMYTAVLRSRPNIADGDAIGGFASTLLALTVSNVVPRVEGVSMAGTPLYVDGGTMSTKVIRGVPMDFRVEHVDEPSDIDLTNANFITEWKFFENGSMLFTTNVLGNPYEAAVPYAFHNAGANRVTVRVKDKDTTTSQFASVDTFTFYVETLGAPTISLTPYHGSRTFLETDTGVENGRIDVHLSMPPSEPITVEIKVAHADPSDTTMLPVLSTYYVNFDSGSTEGSFFLKELDGTGNSALNGFAFTAAVTNETVAPNSGGKSWKDYYTFDSDGLTIYVQNESPQIVGAGDNTITNVATLNMPYTIQWTVSDVLPDMTNGLTASWSVPGEGQFYQPLANVTGRSYTDTFTFAFTRPGATIREVMLTVTDKDGGSSSRRYYFAVSAPPVLIDVDFGGQTKQFSADWIAERMGLSPEWVEAHSALAKSMLEATAANGRLSVVECYALGINPENSNEDFVITEFLLKENGTPDLENIKFFPSRENWTLDMTYKVKGKARLSDEWQDVPSGGGSSFRFFKLVVEP